MRAWGVRGAAASAAAVLLLAAAGCRGQDDAGAAVPTPSASADVDVGHAVDVGDYATEPALAETAAAPLAAVEAPGDLEPLVADGLLEQLGGLEGVLPDGARLAPRPQTWERAGRMAAMLVDATSGGTTDTFVVWLARSPDGTWLITQTEPAAQ